MAPVSRNDKKTAVHRILKAVNCGKIIFGFISRPFGEGRGGDLAFLRHNLHGVATYLF